MPDKVLEVHDLVTRFYTYDGVVRALEGVTFDIGAGETVGLVGETGCGKSVTALSILKLIPSPPGKVEGGQVLFLMPDAERAKLRGLEGSAARMLRTNWASLQLSGDGWAGGLASITVDSTSNPLSQLRVDRFSELARAVQHARLADAVKKDLTRQLNDIYALRTKYDLLAKDEVYMRIIRGNYISMIFQEPMTALNPVINVGDQIAENILLHQRKELCGEAIEWVDKELKEIGGHFVVPQGIPPGTSVRCPRCGAPSFGEPTACTSCHVRFALPAYAVPTSSSKGLVCPFCAGVSPADSATCAACGIEFRTGRKDPGSLPTAFRSRAHLALEKVLSPFSKVKLRVYKGLYRTMARNPDAFGLSVASRVPFLRRYQKVVYGRAMERTIRILRQVRIPDPEKIVSNFPFELSGGMAQRVMISIALSCNPRILIADEPTTALDVTIQAQILKLIRELKDNFHSSVLLITHNLGVVAETCDRVGVMYAGLIAEMAPVRQIFKEPLHPYTKGLMASIPLVTVEKERLEMIKGNVPNLVRPPAGCRFHPRCPVAFGICGWTAKEVSERLVEALGGKVEADLAAGEREIKPRIVDDRTFELARESGVDYDSIRRAVDSHSDPAFTSVEGVEALKTGRVVVRLAKPKVPTLVEPSPGHLVSCHLYGGGVDA